MFVCELVQNGSVWCVRTMTNSMWVWVFLMDVDVYQCFMCIFCDCSLNVVSCESSGLVKSEEYSVQCRITFTVVANLALSASGVGMESARILPKDILSGIVLLILILYLYEYI